MPELACLGACMLAAVSANVFRDIDAAGRAMGTRV
jgi:ribulose kinase